MWPYYLLIVLCTMLCLLQREYVTVIIRKRHRVYSWICMLIILIIFAGLRGSGSGDYTNYVTRGSNIRNFTDIFHNTIVMDYGYCALSWVINLLRLPAQTVIVAMNVISIGSIGKMIKKYSNMPMLSLLLFMPFFFQFDMHAARSACAIGLTTLSIPYALDRKPIKFLFVIFIAAAFHKEALIGIFIYFLPMIKIDLSVGIILLAFDSIIAALNLTDKISLMILERLHLSSLYIRFLSYTDENGAFYYGTHFYDPRFILFFLLFIITCYYMHGKKRTLDRFLINTSFLTIFLMIFFKMHAIMCYRLSSFYAVYSLILVPRLLILRKKDAGMECRDFNKRINIKYIMLVMFCCVFAFCYALKLVPYKIFEMKYW